MTPPLPEHCPCGGWPGDPGVQIPELPDHYNHAVVTHKVERSGKSWAPVADLPRIETEAEAAAKQAVRDHARAQWTAADNDWRHARRWTRPKALRALVILHRPTLSNYDTVDCSFCPGEFRGEQADWPCEHWTLIRQLLP